MNITSNNTMIFAKEFEGKMRYRASMSRKNQNDEYESAYIDVKMPKDSNVENKTKINITKGFLTFYKNKEGKDIWYIVVQEFTQENETEKEQEPQEIFVVKSVKAEDMDLPF